MAVPSKFLVLLLNTLTTKFLFGELCIFETSATALCGATGIYPSLLKRFPSWLSFPPRSGMDVQVEGVSSLAFLRSFHFLRCFSTGCRWWAKNNPEVLGDLLQFLQFLPRYWLQLWRLAYSWIFLDDQENRKSADFLDMFDTKNGGISRIGVGQPRIYRQISETLQARGKHKVQPEVL